MYTRTYVRTYETPEGWKPTRKREGAQKCFHPPFPAREREREREGPARVLRFDSNGGDPAIVTRRFCGAPSAGRE